MIYRVFSNLSSFKELVFHPGLNLLLTEKSQGATDQQTRNGAGKTSFVELVHFLTGGDSEQDSIFKTDALVAYTFGFRFDLDNSPVTMERSGTKPSNIIISERGSLQLPGAPSLDLGSDLVTNIQWKNLLGKLMFNLPSADDERQAEKNIPTFRMLFSYFARRQGSGGFNKPTKQANLQQLGDEQIAISYLLGLDWTIPQQLQSVRDREKTLKELRKASKDGTLGAVVGTSAELRTKVALAEQRSRQLEQQLNTFQVLAEYRELEVEATALTRQLRSLADNNTLDRLLLADLTESMQNEIIPTYNDLERVYREAGVVLPDVAVRRFEEVRAFHESVVQNRRTYLDGEIQTTRQRIRECESQQQKVEARRAEVMGILQSHGALEHFTQLGGELSRLQSETARLRQQFEAAEQIEGQKTELELERGQLHLRLQQDYKEQEATLQQAIIIFQELSYALYEEGGSLTIDATPNGPQFKIDIHAKDSKGINNMQIFCFDMMLMQICARRGLGPGFLIHDSHLFDGVDERQIAIALRLGAQKSVELGFQYVVTMNSDAIPNELLGDEFIQEHALPVLLTDATDTGGLFGLRFK